MIAAVPSFSPLLSLLLLPPSFVSYLLSFIRVKTSLCLFLISVCLSRRSAPVHNTAFWRQSWRYTIYNLIQYIFFASKEDVCVGRCTRVLSPHIPSDTCSQVSSINACLHLSPLFFIWSPPFRLSSLILPLCIVYALHLAYSSQFSIPFLPLPDVGRETSLSFHFLFYPSLFPRLLLSQGPGKRWREWDQMENGVFIYVVLPFLLIFRFFAWRASLSLISEGKEEKEKCRGGVRDCTEQQGTEREWESQSNFFFFFEGLSGRVESKKRRDTRREEECGGVKSVYLPKESDSRLPANNPLWLLHFSATP